MLLVHAPNIMRQNYLGTIRPAIKRPMRQHCLLLQASVVGRLAGGAAVLVPGAEQGAGQPEGLGLQGREVQVSNKHFFPATNAGTKWRLG